MSIAGEIPMPRRWRFFLLIRAWGTRNSARHSSLKARNRSIAWLLISFRSSGDILFGAKYVSTIVPTSASAFYHSGTRKSTYSAYQCVDTDECRYFRLIVDEGVSVQLGCFVDELLVQFLSRSLVSREPCCPILAAPRELSRGERRQTADR
jgi:hypothetical protein